MDRKIEEKLGGQDNEFSEYHDMVYLYVQYNTDLPCTICSGRFTAVFLILL